MEEEENKKRNKMRRIEIKLLSIQCRKSEVRYKMHTSVLYNINIRMNKKKIKTTHTNTQIHIHTYTINIYSK